LPSALWGSESDEKWREALSSYDDVIGRQGIPRLPELDRWYRDDLPAAIAARAKPHITHAELVKVTEWKMARGIWRARNLALVRGNTSDLVLSVSTTALAAIPHLTAPIETLAELAGVGPATASAVASAAAPEIYPFFDELIADQIPGLGKVAYTMSYYARYASALRERAEGFGRFWTPVRVERALWANAGGKAGARKSKMKRA
jgi:hypothetical protein